MAVAPMLQLQEHSTVPAGKTLRFIERTVSTDTPCLLRDSEIERPAKSSIRIHGIGPDRSSGLSRIGTMRVATYPSLLNSQCPGTSPSHGTPESFIAG